MALQKSAMTSLVTAIFTAPSAAGDASGGMQQLLRLPLGLHPTLSQHVDEALAGLAHRRTRSGWPDGTANDYLRILQAYRLARNDFRGSVSVLFDRLGLLRKSAAARNDPAAKGLRHALLALVNMLACVDPDDAYILAEAPEEGSDAANGGHDGGDEVTGWKRRKRIIVTLDDLRKEYQALLDQCSRFERGDYEFGLDEEEEEEDEAVSDEEMKDAGPAGPGPGPAAAR